MISNNKRQNLHSLLQSAVLLSSTCTFMLTTAGTEEKSWLFPSNTLASLTVLHQRLKSLRILRSEDLAGCMAPERFTLRFVVVQASKDGKAEAPAAAAGPASNGSAADVDMKDAGASSSAAPEAGQYSGQLTGTPPSLPSIPSPPTDP